MNSKGFRVSENRWNRMPTNRSNCSGSSLIDSYMAVNKSSGKSSPSFISAKLIMNSDNVIDLLEVYTKQTTERMLITSNITGIDLFIQQHLEEHTVNTEDIRAIHRLISEALKCKQCGQKMTYCMTEICDDWERTWINTVEWWHNSWQWANDDVHHNRYNNITRSNNELCPLTTPARYAQLHTVLQ